MVPSWILLSLPSHNFLPATPCLPQIVSFPLPTTVLHSRKKNVHIQAPTIETSSHTHKPPSFALFKLSFNPSPSHPTQHSQQQLTLNRARPHLGIVPAALLKSRYIASHRTQRQHIHAMVLSRTWVLKGSLWIQAVSHQAELPRAMTEWPLAFFSFFSLQITPQVRLSDINPPLTILFPDGNRCSCWS